MKKLNKSLKANRNNIETYLPLFNGFYGSYWSEPEFEGEIEHYNLPRNFPFWDYLNWSEYYEDLSKAITNKVEELLSDFVEKIEYQNLYSPKYYNFSNDSINCIIRPKKAAIKAYIYENKEAFEKYLESNLKSRDGFISFHSYHFEDWQNDTKNFTAWDKKIDSKGFNLGFVLNFICHNEKIDYTELYYGTDGVYASNYLNAEFDEIINGKRNEVEPFINENYSKHSTEELLQMVSEKYEEEETLNIILETAKECIKKIESNTLEIIF